MKQNSTQLSPSDFSAMALLYASLLVAACLQLSQAHPTDVIPATGAGSLKTNWANEQGDWTAWNLPAAIPNLPQVNGNIGSLAPVLGALAPWKTVAAQYGNILTIPGAEHPWNIPAPVPYTVERNWNTPAYPPTTCPPSTWTEQYWVNPAPLPTLIGAPEVAPSPQDSNWNGWSGQNAHTWNLAAPAPAGPSAAELNTIQVPAPIELPAPRQLPAPRALPQAPALRGPIQLPQVQLPQAPALYRPQLPHAPALHGPIQLPQVQQRSGPHHFSGPFQLSGPIQLQSPIHLTSTHWRHH